MDPVSFGTLLGIFTALGFLGMLFVVGLVIVVMYIDGLCLRYLIEYWSAKQRGTYVPVRVPVLLLGLCVVGISMLIPAVTDMLVIGAAACTLVASFFITNDGYAGKPATRA